jgi:ribosomal protein S8
MKNQTITFASSINLGISLRCKNVSVPKTKKIFLILNKLQKLGFIGNFVEIIANGKRCYSVKLLYDINGCYIKNLRLFKSTKKTKNFNISHHINKRQMSLGICLFETNLGILDSNEIIETGIPGKILLEVI